MCSDVGGPAADVSEGVVARLRARHHELVGAIFERVRGDAFDRSGAHDVEYMEGLHAAVGAAVEYALQGIEHGEGWTGEIPVVAVEQARRAARVGVSLDTVLRRYVVGHTMLWDLVMVEAEHGGGDAISPAQRGAVRIALRAQAVVLDRLLGAVTRAYEQEQKQAGRGSERRRAERVRGLLDGEPVESAGLEYGLEGWHLGVIATGTGAVRIVRELAVGVDRRLLSVAPGERSVWAWLGGRERFVVADVERFIGMGSHPPVSVVLALGEPARGLEGWRVTHRQAQAAFVVALRRNGIPRNGIPPAQGVMLTRYGDVALLASALKDEALARALLEIYIAPLDDGRGGGPVLCATLRAYLAAERSVSSAAAALGVVRRTVENRLSTIEERLGRSLHPCPAELEVALELDGLVVPPGSPEISNIGEIVA